MKWFLLALTIFTIHIYASAYLLANEKNQKPILVIALHNAPGIPEGWIDSTTREDATEICNKLIANQSKEYATPISRSRCIIKVQE